MMKIGAVQAADGQGEDELEQAQDAAEYEGHASRPGFVSVRREKVDHGVSSQGQGRSIVEEVVAVFLLIYGVYYGASRLSMAGAPVSI